MAIEEEKKDGLFQNNLGDGLIEVETSVEEETTETKKEPVKTEETPATGFTEHEDGTIEIDPYLQATIDAGVKTEDGTDIDKTESDKEKGKTSSDGDGSSDSSPSSPYLAFAKDRANEGVFLDFTDEDWQVLMERNDKDEAAALRELSAISMQRMVEQGVNQYKETLTDEDRQLYEAKEKGIPVDQYGIAKNNFQKYSKIKVEDLNENEELQIQVVSKMLELRGFTADEIKEEVEGYKALENLEKKAQTALPAIPKVYKKQIDDLETNAENDEKSRKDQVRQRVSKMKQMVDQTPEIIPGIKLTKPVREKIMKSMIEPVSNDENGNPLNPVMTTRSKNPDAFEMMIHYYHQLGLFNIDEHGAMKPDFSKIAKIEQTKAADTMRDIFESKEKNVTGTTKTIKTEEDELSDFDRAFKNL